MQYIQGISRNQLQMGSLEDKIAADNPIRFIDAFVGFIDLQKIGFEPRLLNKDFCSLPNATFQLQKAVFY